MTNQIHLILVILYRNVKGQPHTRFRTQASAQKLKTNIIGTERV